MLRYKFGSVYIPNNTLKIITVFVLLSAQFAYLFKVALQVLNKWILKHNIMNREGHAIPEFFSGRVPACNTMRI